LPDPAAAHQLVPTVDHTGLPGCDGALRFRQPHRDHVVADALDHGRYGEGATPHLHENLLARHRWLGQPVQVADRHVAPQQLVMGADDYLVRRGMHAEHVERTAATAAESLSLPD